MDPALASIIGTAILGVCSMGVAFITARSTDAKTIAAAREEGRQEGREQAMKERQSIAGGTDEA